MENVSASDSRGATRWGVVVWPAFLAACLLQALVFAMVDPAEIHWNGYFSQPSRQGVYSVAFFCFWLIAVGCGGLVLWLGTPQQKVNDRLAD